MCTQMRLSIVALFVLWARPTFAEQSETEAAPNEASEMSVLDGAMQSWQRLVEILKTHDSRLSSLEAAPTSGTPADTQDVQDLQEELEDLRLALSELENSTAEQLVYRMNFSGYTTSYFRKQQGESPYFRGFRVNLLADSRITRNLRFFAEFEFEDAARVGGGQGLIETERGFVELGLTKKVALRTGIVLLPFGYYNIYHEGWRIPFADRPMINHHLFPSTYSDVGAKLVGSMDFGDETSLRYQLAVTNGLSDNIATKVRGTGLRSARPEFRRDNNSPKSVSGRLSVIHGSFDIGSSGYWGAYSSDGDAGIGMVGLDARYDTDSAWLRAEGMFIRVADGARLEDVDGDPMTPAVSEPFASAMAGAVVEGEWRPKSKALNKLLLSQFTEARLMLAARVEAAGIQYGEWNREVTARVALGIRPVHRSAFRVEFAKGWGDFALEDNWMGAQDADNASLNAQLKP